MKFSMIPHFFVGLYMYTNSSIITPTDISSNLYGYINSGSRYLNNQRFANIHSAIFLACFAFFLRLFIFRYTLFMVFGKIKRSCKK